ncbi:MAG: hypothetical protein V3T42_00685 [Nitrospirales bacterium]
MVKNNTIQSILWVALGTVGVSVFSGWVLPPDSHAIPAFARKYTLNCNVCHTRPPRLNSFGEQFLENGYQLPGTEDGGIVGKKRLGELTLDDVTNYLAFRIRGNAIRHFDQKSRDSKTEIGFPETFNLFTAGTLTTNVGFFVEVESNVEEGEIETERTFVTFNNIGLHDLVHLRIGKFDPSAFFSYPTHRQQLNPVRPDVTNPGGFVGATIRRIPLLPNAFASKFFGLFDREGTAILPFEASLFNSPAEMGIDVHGRPFGKWFLYQVGVLNGANETFGDSNNHKDVYVMVRVDHAQSDLFSASLSGFAYFGESNAKLGTGRDVDWSRYGVAGNVRYNMVDVYGAFVIDHVTNLPAGLAFDDTATGLTVEADVLVTDRVLLSLRFDHMDAGGALSKRKSNSLLGMQAKYYLRPNIALYVRDDFNLRDSEGGGKSSSQFQKCVFYWS